MKKFKIAFVVNYFPSISETFILNQITDIVERGHEVKIYAFNARQQKIVHKSVERYDLIEKTTYFRHFSRSSIEKLVSVISFAIINVGVLSKELGLNVFNSKVLRKFIFELSLSASLEKFLNGSNFDIVHAHFGQRGAIVANLMAQGKVKNLKFVTSFHGYDLNPSFVDRYKIEYKNIFHFANIITVNTKYLESVLQEVYPGLKNLIVLHEGLKTEQYKREHLSSGHHTSNLKIVFCGRLVEFKAPDLAVRIMDILVNGRGLKNVTLRIIGEGELRKEIEHLIDKFRLKNHVILLGALSQESVIKEMNDSDLFLLPGIHERETGRAEAQGLVIQEAQAMELPVIVSEAGGMKYGLIDGESGFVVKENDIDAFADKIGLFMKDKELGKKMGKAGRDFVTRNFDTRILGDKLLDIYSTITADLYTDRRDA